MIKIVYACNDGYFDGLYLSILSVVRRTKEPIAFYLLSADFVNLEKKYLKMTKEHGKVLSDLVKQYNHKSTFTIIDCTKEAEKDLTTVANVAKKFTPYTCLRLLIDQFPQLSGKVLYLDSDTMACGDIKELYDHNVNNCEMMVCHNWWFRNTFTKNSFNAGVILFNIDKCKETNLFKKSIHLLNTHKYKWADQTALNNAATSIKYFPGDEFRFNRQSEKIYKNDIIKHFCNRWRGWPFWDKIKQWDIKNVHNHLKIFIFDEDYKIWTQYKEQNKNFRR